MTYNCFVFHAVFNTFIANLYINGSGLIRTVSESTGDIQLCVLLRYGQPDTDFATFLIESSTPSIQPQCKLSTIIGKERENIDSNIE